MPSKNGFGNTRKKSPAMKYGAGKNPITMKSPLKTRFGRWLMGRKKHDVSYDLPGAKGAGRGIMITDKHGNVVKTKTEEGVTTKYKKGSRPQHPTIR